MSEVKPLVAIHCLVYNHAPYLRDCLEGFVMQQTNFPFVAIVHDDASTDGSAAIIREYEEKYPNIIKPIYEPENQWRKLDGSLGRIMNAAIDATGAKYVAVCEGDDYWTDPLKLQKQVDFLESHLEYDMVCARFNHLFHETGEISCTDLYDKLDIVGNGIEIKQKHFVDFIQPHPCTVMYRKDSLYDHPIIPKLKYRFDIPIYYCFLYLHRVWLMNEKMAIYRKHAGSLTAGGDTPSWSLTESHKELLSYFPEDPNLKLMVQCDFRKIIMYASLQESYTLKDFVLHLSNYIAHKPKIRNIISFVVKILRNRIKYLCGSVK